jgi:hypothetical protein
MGLAGKRDQAQGHEDARHQQAEAGLIGRGIVKAGAACPWHPASNGRAPSPRPVAAACRPNSGPMLQIPEAVPISRAGTDSLAKAKPMIRFPETKPVNNRVAINSHTGNGRKMISAQPANAAAVVATYSGRRRPRRSDREPRTGPPTAQAMSSSEVMAAAVLVSRPCTCCR